MKIFTRFLLLILAFVPWIMSQSYFFPFISGKNLFIRIVITIVAACVAGYLVANTAFKKETFERVKKYFTHPISLWTSGFMALMVLSTLFAHNTYRAFLGDVERAEGLLGLLFFFSFFVFSLVLFEKKQWIRFFQLTLVAGGVMFLHQLIQLGKDISRPSSFTGNPIYLAGFFLFTLFSAAIVFYEYRRGQKDKKETSFGSFWRIVSLLMIPVSVLGIFITETRGVIVGLIVGALVFLIYGYVRGNDVSFGSFTLRKVSLWIIGGIIFCSAIFYVSRDSLFWQGIPGFDRLSQVSSKDATLQTRLISLGVSVQAVNPAQHGIGRFLIGWGPENFNIAYNAHYNPEYFRYEQAWFDRAHNKLMDVAVMQGFLGLITYCGIWGSLFWILFRRKGFSFERGMMIFFATTYFVQNLFVFDSIATYIPFFGFLAFCIFYDREHTSTDSIKLPSWAQPVIVGKFVVLALFFVYAFIAWTIVPFSQMYRYVHFSKGSNGEKGVDIQSLYDLFTPYTYVQELLRTNLLDRLREQYSGKESEEKALLRSIATVEDLSQHEPYNPRTMVKIGQAYDTLADKGLTEYYEKSEAMYRKALSLAPQRQDLQYLLAYSLSSQNKYDEAMTHIRAMINSDPMVATSYYYATVVTFHMKDDTYLREIFADTEKALSQNSVEPSKPFVDVYYMFLKHFYDQKDKENLLIVLNRLITINPERKDDFARIVDSIKKGEWLNVNFGF